MKVPKKMDRSGIITSAQCIKNFIEKGTDVVSTACRPLVLPNLDCIRIKIKSVICCCLDIDKIELGLANCFAKHFGKTWH